MMTFTTSRKLLPGALSDDAAVLLKQIWQAVRWMPCWGDMTKAQIDAFGELQRACYIEACAWGEYRVKGRDTMSAVRQYQQERNAQLNVLYAGVDPLVAKWEGLAGFKNYRVRPWLPTARIREAHLQLESDIKLTLNELKRAG
jgi:hypothetical protein